MHGGDFPARALRTCSVGILNDLINNGRAVESSHKAIQSQQRLDNSSKKSKSSSVVVLSNRYMPGKNRESPLKQAKAYTYLLNSFGFRENPTTILLVCLTH